MMKPSQWQIAIVLVVGIIGVSLAAIWIRLAIDAAIPHNRIGFSLFLAASRLIVAALILLVTRKNLMLPETKPQAYYYAIAAGICLGIHFATWITSLAYTSIAASTVLVTTNPIWVGLFSWWWYREKLPRQSIVAVGIALIGGMMIAIADTNSSGSYSNPLLGDILALMGAVMSSLYIIFGSQAQRVGLSTGNYIAIAYSTAAVGLFPLPFLADTSYFGYGGKVYLYVFMMAVMSQVVGHTSLNWSLRWVSPTLVSLSLLFEPVVASLVGAIVFDEIPSGYSLLGGLIVLLGIAIFLRTERH